MEYESLGVVGFRPELLDALRAGDGEQRLSNLIAALDVIEPEPELAELPEQFDRVVEILDELDWDTIWDAASDTERRTLLDEFVPAVNVYGDRLEVEIRGALKTERSPARGRATALVR